MKEKREIDWRALKDMGYEQSGSYGIFSLIKKKGMDMIKEIEPLNILIYGLVVLCFLGIILHVAGVTQMFKSSDGYEYVAEAERR